MKKAIKSTLVLTVAAALLAASVVFATACDTKKAVASIEITTAPAITEYVEGDLFNTAGMVVTAKYEDGTTEVVTGYTLSATEALTPADTSVTVTYEEKTATQAITVAANDLKMLAVTQAPRTDYKTNEAFDTKGMVVTAAYADGTIEEVTDYTVYPAARALNENDKDVLISYGGMTAKQMVNVSVDLSAPTKAPIVYNAVGTADVGGQKANINFLFRKNGIVTGILESGMGADTDNMIANFISFPGTWEKTGDAFTVRFYDFTFDPSTLANLLKMFEDMIPEDMKDMVDSIIEMDPVDIKGCVTNATLTDEAISFKADFEAMGIALAMECKGDLPQAIQLKAGDHAEAEFGNLDGLIISSGSLIAANKNYSNGYCVSGSTKKDSVWKTDISSAAAAEGATITLRCAAGKKNVDVNEYLALKVNGTEVPLTGTLASSVTFADLTATADFVKGTNTLELVWKADVSVKLDYLTFSTDVTLLDPALGII